MGLMLRLQEDQHACTPFRSLALHPGFQCEFCLVILTRCHSLKGTTPQKVLYKPGFQCLEPFVTCALSCECFCYPKMLIVYFFMSVGALCSDLCLKMLRISTEKALPILHIASKICILQ